MNETIVAAAADSSAISFDNDDDINNNDDEGSGDGVDSDKHVCTKSTYENLMRPIRSRYPSLQYTMSDKFYDESQFFSSEMLLGRDNTTDYIWKDLMPAYKEYTKLHVNLTKEYQLPPPDDDDDGDNSYYKMMMEKIRIGQKAYDDYSSVRDPAHGLLAALFGKSYADEFVYDVLFPLSDGPPS